MPPLPRPVPPVYVTPYRGLVYGMLLALPATAIAIATATGTTYYKVDTKCYVEQRDGGTTYYAEVDCP
ncbi:hypothetical protein JCM14635_02810 [Megalodesulfovibrio paquesii]